MGDVAVHIVLSDEGWILEKLARKLTASLSYVTADLDVDPSADIQYYMTYSTSRYRVSIREMAYFAHVEQDEATRKRFFDVARRVDYCICHSKPYEDLLCENGIDHVRTVSPGVDLELFTPLVKIGIVGRTYHTGRKGERLVAAMMDIPGIEWHFTGEGWPGPTKFLAPEEMPAFYRSMDYILVPSLYEGGPMSVVEALACGCEVIAPPVGWVPEFPHIEYKTGDVDDLRRVLTGVVEKRQSLRESVLTRSWQGWVDGHRQVFEQLAETLPEGSPTRRPVSRIQAESSVPVRSVGLVLHGSEGADRGGPSTRVPRTALRLSRLGFNAQVLSSGFEDPRPFGLLHIFNDWHPDSCRRAFEQARFSTAPVVFSPIHLDLSERAVFNEEIPNIFRNSYSDEAISDEFARLREKRRRQSEAATANIEPYSGYFTDIRELVNASDHLICLSEHERKTLQDIGVDTSHSTIIRNPVETQLYSQATPDLFYEAFGVKDYVLCVGRLEARKNQITLLYALRDLSLPLVIIGHAVNPNYQQLLASVAGRNVHFIGRLPIGSPLLASAYAGARVFTLPSWSEGAPLVALEAAAAGCNMVLSNRSSEREYFGANARYADPANPEELKGAVLAAYESPLSEEKRQALKAWTGKEFSWERHVEETAAVYQQLMTTKSHRAPPRKPKKIYVDLTSSGHREGPPSGIARVEQSYAFQLHRLMPERIRFVLWNSHHRVFVNISYDQFISGKFKNFVSDAIPSFLIDPKKNPCLPYGQVEFEPDSILLVLGGAWIRNPHYVECLSQTKRAKNLNLVAFIHDTIQIKFKHWFSDKVGDEFADNCERIIKAADHLLVNSECTKQDTIEFCKQRSMLCPPIDAVRFGDEIEAEAADSKIQFDLLPAKVRGLPFILCVSALDIRKNHILLYNLWERMLNEYGEKTPSLVMVGGKGWSIDPFLDMVSHNKKVQGYFHILHGISDGTLDWLYRNCLFTVYPSLYEGWGLPVAESLKYGRICVAANAGAVPEIAPERTDLIDPLDFVTWYRTVTGYIFNPELRKRRLEKVKGYRSVSWKESAEELMIILNKLVLRAPMAQKLKLGHEIRFDSGASKNASFAPYSIGGWYAPERRGCWTAGQTAALQFRLAGECSQHLLFSLTGTGFCRDKARPQQIDVRMNDQPIGKLFWADGQNKDILLLSQAMSNELQNSPSILLTLHIAEPMSPAALGRGADKRMLGAMVESLKFEAAPCVPCDLWIEPSSTKPDGVGGPRLAPLLCEGESSYRIPLRTTDHHVKAIAARGENVYLGLQLALNRETPRTDDEVPLEISNEGGFLGGCDVGAKELVTRWLILPAESLVEGTVIEIRAMKGDLERLDVIELGVFTTQPALDLFDLKINAVVLCNLPSTPSGIQAVHQRSLPERQTLARTLTNSTFLTGWSRPDANGVKTDQEAAYLILKPDASGRSACLLSFEVLASRSAKVEVKVNGSHRALWTLISTQQQQRFITLKAEDLSLNGVLIEFRIRDLLPVSDELERPSLHLSSFALIDHPSDVPKELKSSMQAGFIELVDLSLPLSPTFASFDNWHKPEPSNGRWMNGCFSSVQINIVSDFKGPVRLVGIGRTVPVKMPDPQVIEVFVNGISCGTQYLENRRANLIDLPVPDEALDGSFPLTVNFKCSYAISPLEAGLSIDNRNLGVLIQSFAIVPANNRMELSSLLPGFQDLSADASSTPTPVESGGDADASEPVGEDEAAGKAAETVSPVGSEAEANRSGMEPRHGTFSKSGPEIIVVDFSLPLPESEGSVTGWHAAEPGIGRWTNGPTGRIQLLKKLGVERDYRFVAVARFLGANGESPSQVEISIDGTSFAVVSIGHGRPFTIDLTVPAKQFARSNGLTVDIKLPTAMSPSQLDGSEDRRRCGLLLRSFAFIPVDSIIDIPSLVPDYQRLITEDTLPLEPEEHNNSGVLQRNGGAIKNQSEA